MRVINVSLNELETKVLMIGFQGENEITQVRIDAAEILTDYPNATPTLIVKPLFGFAYPVIVAMESTDVVWNIDNSVLSIHGDGEIQLTFTSGSVIAKSYVGRIRIKRSLAVNGEAPDPIETWEQAATAKLAEVDAQISELEDMVEAAEAAKDQAQDIVDDAAADIQAAGAAQVGNVNSAGATQVGAVQAKGTEVLNSIPADYTELSDDVTDLKSAIYDYVVLDMSVQHRATLEENKGSHIPTNVGVGNIVSFTPLSSPLTTSWAIYDCEKDDVFEITGKGGNAPRIWAFVDNDNKLTAVSDADLIVSSPVIITAPSDGKLICNVTSLTSPLPTLVKKYWSNKLEVLSEKVTDTTLKKSGYAADAEVTGKVTNVGLAESAYNKGVLSAYASDFGGWYVGRNESYYGKWDNDNIPVGDGFGYLTTYAHVISKFDALMAMDTSYVSKRTLGTASGLDANNNPYLIYEYVFKPNKYPNNVGNKIIPKIFLQCCAHGFEKNACYSTYYWLYDAVNNWAKDTRLKAIRQNVELHVIPVLNPYGFDHNQYYNANNVNINRNYDVPNWTYVPSTDPTNSSGEAPFDQPETQIVKSWIEANTDALILIDCHTNGQYYASGYNNANALMPVSDVDDDYYNKIFEILSNEIDAQSLIFPTMYQNIALAPSGYLSYFGRIQSDAYNLGYGYAKTWAVTKESIMAFTLEIFNGLRVDGTEIFSYMSEDAKKIGSEMIGNVIAELVKCYAQVNAKI